MSELLLSANGPQFDIQQAFFLNIMGVPEGKAANVMWFGLPAGMLIIAGLLIYNCRLRNKPKNEEPPCGADQNDIDHEYMHRELAGKALQLASMTDMMISVSRRIYELLPRVGPHEKDELLAIIRELEDKSYSDAWHNFENQLEYFDRDFYRVLAELYPDLTPAEKRVCTFLRLNMTTKEIAALTNRSTRTIDFTRNSIRKKLQLSSETNLSAFLLSI